MDTSLEEAALTAGSSTWTTFKRITLPLMRPALFSVLLIVFIRGIEAFEVPALIGVPAKISVFTTKIFLAIHQFPSDFGLAGSYAVTLLVISSIGVLIYGRITRREERYATVTGKGYGNILPARCLFLYSFSPWFSRSLCCCGRRSFPITAFRRLSSWAR
jgi:iron(III) transport system permease protein